MVTVQVRDTGIGIKKEDPERIFEPFPAIKKPEHVKGEGLGLSISRGLVELHGGKIWAESLGEGRGATFTFTLPKKEAD
jgi:signal transduction histidine kinase